MSVDPISLGAGLGATSPLSGFMAGVGSANGLAPIEQNALGTGNAVTFGNVLNNHLEGVQAAQKATDVAAVQAATGDLNDIHDYMIASSKSGVAVDLTVAVRNKAVEAFTEIMRMQA